MDLNILDLHPQQVGLRCKEILTLVKYSKCFSKEEEWALKAIKTQITRKTIYLNLLSKGVVVKAFLEVLCLCLQIEANLEAEECLDLEAFNNFSNKDSLLREQEAVSRGIRNQTVKSDHWNILEILMTCLNR